MRTGQKLPDIGLIYCAGNLAEYQRVKIGYATDVGARLSGIETGALGCKLYLYSLVVGDMKTESDLHARFADYKVHREWFSVTDDLAAWLTNQTDWYCAEGKSWGDLEHVTKCFHRAKKHAAGLSRQQAFNSVAVAFRRNLSGAADDGPLTHQEDPLLTPRAIGKLLGKHPSTIRNWIDSGLLECVIQPTGRPMVRTSVVIQAFPEASNLSSLSNAASTKL